MTDSLLSDDWLNKLIKYRVLYVGFSGGLDSTVLLHQLASHPALQGKLQAIHIHHGLSVNADAWQTHCQDFCKKLAIPLIVHQVEFERGANIEEHARTARYQVFSSLLTDQDCLLLGHHGDDQAETLLLQLLRGAGIDGLAAMADCNSLAKGVLARPFLQHTRQMLAAYASQHQLSFVDDESNQDSAYSRNYIRHQIMPLLQVKWPGVVQNLMRTATHCQQAKMNLEVLANLDYPGLAEQGNTLVLTTSLLACSHTRLANVLRGWLKNNRVRYPSANVLARLINDVILASPDAKPRVEWDDIAVSRYNQTLYLLKRGSHPQHIKPGQPLVWASFPAPLSIGNNEYVHATAAENGVTVPMGSCVEIRFRQGGELFSWHGQTKQLKKLLQQWQVPPWQRDVIPLLYIDGQLAAVVGFAISDGYYGTDFIDTYDVSIHVS